MKKILLIAAMILGVTIFSQNIVGTENVAMAKERTISTNLVNKMKKGTLPGAEGKVGMTLKTLKSKSNVYFDPAEEFLLYRSKKFTYGFTNNYRQKVKSSAKIKIVIREYDFSFSKSSIRKKLGPQLPTYGAYGGYETNSAVYKVGKYYAMVFDINNKTNVYVGTKSAICIAAWVEKIYD